MDAFTGAKEKGPDMFDPFNSLAADDLPGSPAKHGSMFHKKALALNEPTLETSDKGWGNDLDYVETEIIKSPLKLRSEMSKYKHIPKEN